MENKKSFILYADIIHTVSKLNDKDAGKLLKLILAYVNDQNSDESKYDLIIQIAFEPIKRQLKRDLQKYSQYIEKQRENGKKGGRPKQSDDNPEKPKITQPFFGKPKKADNDNDNDNDNVTDTVNVNENRENNNKYDFVSDDFQNIVKDWLDYKKDRKESYKSEKSIESFYNKLHKLSGGSQALAAEIIEQSMANNWAGIFELKTEIQKPKLKRDWAHETDFPQN